MQRCDVVRADRIGAEVGIDPSRIGSYHFRFWPRKEVRAEILDQVTFDEILQTEEDHVVDTFYP